VPHPFYAQFDRGRWTRETARERLGVQGEVALFFGYVRRYKGLDVLLSAWKEVRERRPATLLVAGEFYEDPAPYRRLAAAAGGDPGVRLLERYLPDEEVECVFKAADVVVLPYRSATQSGVTHVAYALGVPVIITGVGGLAETVRGGETGLVVPPENPPALAEAIVRFFAEGMRERLAAGVGALKAEHSWERLAEHTVALVDALRPARGWR
jgi:glycosyltransferase involved in cell wall biosynthesis